MKVHFLTIVLDGMPNLPCHLPTFNTLSCDWDWHIVEGVARNVSCTKWCKPLMPRLSIDGTTEYLDAIKSHKRVKVYRKQLWEGKIEMVNAPLREIQEPGLLIELDSDEIWRADQIEKIVRMFEACPDKDTAQFKCRYYVGPDIVITSDNTYGNHYDYEWYRAWRWNPGQLFTTHEPPKMGGSLGRKFSVQETSQAGLVFEHYAYATPEAVAFKEYYYGYSGALDQWARLQSAKFPVKLKDYLSWIKDEATADKL